MARPKKQIDYTLLEKLSHIQCTDTEIAEVLGISVENAKVRLHRARKKLRVILEEKCTFEMDDRNVLTCEPRHKQ